MTEVNSNSVGTLCNRYPKNYQTLPFTSLSQVRIPTSKVVAESDPDDAWDGSRSVAVQQTMFQDSKS